MTLVPTYTFVGNLFQAFVMYARVRPTWFKTIWFGSDKYLTMLGHKQATQHVR